MAIKLILEVFNSKRDLNGNRYWAFVLTDAASGKKVAGSLGAAMDGGAQHIAGHLGYEWDAIHENTMEMPKREFQAMTKGWPYLPSPQAVREAFKALRVKFPKDKRRW